MNSSIWSVIYSQPGAPAWNMAVDEALMLHAAELPGPLLRFYSWSEPAATFGYFQRHAEVGQWTPLRPLVRRPTGGGLVPHDADWTYSLVFPAAHPWHSLLAIESYKRLHEWLHAAFAECRLQTELATAAIAGGPGQCFVGAEQFDLLLGRQKIAGAAQRRAKTALLIQGSVQPVPRNIARQDWERAMVRVAGPFGAGSWVEGGLSDAVITTARQLETGKYSLEAYNRRR